MAGKSLAQLCREAAAAGQTYGQYVSAQERRNELHIPEDVQPVRTPEPAHPQGHKREPGPRAARIIALLGEGLTPMQVAQRLGITRSRVYYVMATNGLPSSVDRRREEQMRLHGPRVRALWAAGQSLAEIALTVGLTPTAVADLVRMMGLGLDDEPQKLKTAEAYTALFDKGLSVAEIACKLGVCRATVYNRLHAAGYSKADFARARKGGRRDVSDV